MKFVTIVGARPQFIKAAMLSKELRKKHIEILVHTGQHFDDNMSKIFFDELNIPSPNYNLGISGGSHSEMTSRMLVEIEKTLIVEKPDAVIVYGDTNSTLSAALVASKMNIPVIHIEAGNRVETLANPEEINRICTDHLSSLLFYCVPSAGLFLKKENLINKSFFSGDLMLDAFTLISNSLKKNSSPVFCFTSIDGKSGSFDLKHKYIYLTCHRQENDVLDKKVEILAAANALGLTVIYPVHPRNKKVIDNIKKDNDFKNIIFVEPIGYLESINLVLNSELVITDSGGVQREAFFAKKQCITILDFVCWPETMINNCNQLSKADRFDIIAKSKIKPVFLENYKPFGSGNAGKIIVEKIEEYFL